MGERWKKQLTLAWCGMNTMDIKHNGLLMFVGPLWENEREAVVVMSFGGTKHGDVMTLKPTNVEPHVAQDISLLLSTQPLT